MKNLMIALLLLATPAAAGPIGDTLTRDQLPPSRAQQNNTSNGVANPNTRNALAVAKARGWRVQVTSSGYVINGKFYPSSSSGTPAPWSPSRGITSCHGSGCR